jgi:hypothetical protein
MSNDVMVKTKVLLVGATGATGGSIIDGLLQAGNFVGITVHHPVISSWLTERFCSMTCRRFLL